MIIVKSFKYRIYPTVEQSERLNAWSGSLRFLWNLAHEQRLMGLARTDKVYHTAFDQISGKDSRGTHGNAVCGGSAIKRPMKQKLRVVKRGTQHKNDCLGMKAPAFMPG